MVGEVHHNLPPSSLYEHAIRYERDSSIAENGALVAYSGVKTGRSPKDKRITYRHGSSVYHVIVENIAKTGHGAGSVMLDGRAVPDASSSW